LPLLTLEELQQQAQDVSWLVKGVIPADSVGMFFGASGTFKSFIALDLALHIVHGMQWLRRKTRRAPVIWIAAEGGAGTWKRIEAWHREHGIIWQGAPIYVVPVALDLAQEAYRVVEAVKAKLPGVTPGAIFASWRR
jgi:anti-sigma factor RsiW